MCSLLTDYCSIQDLDYNLTLDISCIDKLLHKGRRKNSNAECFIERKTEQLDASI